MAHQFSLGLNLQQQPVRGIKLDLRMFPGGIGQPPVMPCLVAKAEVPEGFDIHSVPFERYECTLELYDGREPIRLSEDMFFRLHPVRCQLVRSIDDQNRVDALFIFNEIIIRHLGVFRMRVILSEIGQDSPPREVASVMTDRFDIVEYDEFPGGAVIWTRLSQHLRVQGIVLHLPPNNDSINWDEEYPTINGVP